MKLTIKLALAILITSITINALEITNDLRDLIFQAEVYSASGENWTEINANYKQIHKGWEAPSGNGCFYQNINSVGGITKECIFAHPEYGGDSLNATVAEYTIKNPLEISTNYGIADGALTGEVRFIVQIKDNNNYTTILDSLVEDTLEWRSFEYDYC